MNWNIAIGVFIAILALGTSALAGHLASSKDWHRWVFWGGGVMMLILIVVQTVQNEHARRKLQEQLDRIQKNTERPPQVNVSVPPPQVIVGGRDPQHTHVDFLTPDVLPFSPEPIVPFQQGQQIHLNLGVYDNGDYPASHSFIAARIFIKPDSSNTHDIFAAFLETAHFEPCGTLIPHQGKQGCYRTHISERLSQEQAAKLNSGDLAVFLVGRAKWSDETGTYHTDFCEYLAQETPKLFNWHISEIDRSETKERAADLRH